MSIDARDARVEALLQQADTTARQGNTQQALSQIKEAAQLDGENEKVRQALEALQLSARSTLLEHLKLYATSNNNSNLEQLETTLKQDNPLSSAHAVQCLDVILAQDYTQGSWATIFSTVLARQKEIRKAIAARFEDNVEGLVNLLLKTDERASSMLYGVVLEPGVWHSEQACDQVQQDAFAKLSQRLEGKQQIERLRIAILLSRQLRAKPILVASKASDSVYVATYFLMDNRMTPLQQNSGYAGLTQLFKASPERSEALFTRIITTYVTSGQRDELIIALSVASRMFLTLSTVSVKLFLTEGFLQHLSTLLETSRITEADASETNLLQRLTLDLLSAACVDNSCREAIKQQCGTQLNVLSQAVIENVSTQAGLILVKLSSVATDNAVVTRLMQTALKTTTDAQLAVEGLAYASLNPAIKEKIISTTRLTTLLVENVRTQQQVFSSLTIIDNLTAYRLAKSEEQKKMAQLKAYANQSQPAAEDPLDNNGMVAARGKRLLDAGIVSALATVIKNVPSTEERRLKVHILNSLAREAKHRTKMVQEGVIRVLLSMNEHFTSSSTPDSAAAQRIGAHALAKVLISVNPEHVFSTALPASSAVGAILPLLEIDQQQDERDLLPTFEALLALTNLASMGDQSICDLIIRKGWPTLEDQHLLASNRLIQRASVELVCNLMLSPAGVAKFADGSDEAARRLHILLALADVDDLATRRAAGGALAMLTEWDTAVKAVLKIERGTTILLSMASDKSEEIMHRGIVCLLNCCKIPALADEAITKLKQANAATVIKQASKATKNPDLLAVIDDLLRHLT